MVNGTDHEHQILQLVQKEAPRAEAYFFPTASHIYNLISCSSAQMTPMSLLYDIEVGGKFFGIQRGQW